MTMPIRELLQATLTERMRARDRDTVSALRSALAAIANAEAVPVEQSGPAVATSADIAGAAVGLGAAEAPRRDLTEEQMRDLVAAEADERADLSRLLGEKGDSDGARRAFGQATALRFLLDRAARG